MSSDMIYAINHIAKEVTTKRKGKILWHTGAKPVNRDRLRRLAVQ